MNVMSIGVPLANMYAEAADTSPVVSQALYGETIKWINTLSDYSFIQTPDQYQGWVHTSVLYPELHVENSARTIHNTSHVYASPHVTHQKPLLSLPFGVSVTVLSQPPEEEGRWIELLLVDGSKGWVQRSNLNFEKHLLTLSGALELSCQFLGLPYTWGGTSSFGYDCSGYIQMLFKEMGIGLPRDASQQINSEYIVPVEEGNLIRGDIIFYGLDESKIQHVSLYLGNDKIIHASVLPEPVIKIYPVNEPSLKKRYPYFVIKRIKKSFD